MKLKSEEIYRNQEKFKEVSIWRWGAATQNSVLE